MAEGSSDNRWWEGYLVRYFVPALLGLLIVRWMLSFADKQSSLIIVNASSLDGPLDWTSLASLVVAGFLYCYISSYPILVFHATRSLDFRDNGNKHGVWFINPYALSILFLCLAYVVVSLYWTWLSWIYSYILIVVIVFAYSFIQCIRLYKCFSVQKPFAGNPEFISSLGYAYTYKLARRRTKTGYRAVNFDVISMSTAGVAADNKQKMARRGSYYSDISETYRHLREHGNTAFIIVLELAMCPVMIVAMDCKSLTWCLYYLVPILVLWVTPSVFVHWYAQHLERRFSLFR